MLLSDWQAPLPGGGTAEELFVAFDGQRNSRLLVIPPFFDEHNKLRRQLVEIMRRLDLAGIDSWLPDLPGCNESLAPLQDQTLAGWRDAASTAAVRFGATHALAVRGGALLVPAELPAFVYSPQSGARLVRALARARSISAREAGRAERAEDVLAQARQRGAELAGWRLGAGMVRQLEAARYEPLPHHTLIDPEAVGGAPLWLRAEPDEDPEQADAIATILAIALADPT